MRDLVAARNAENLFGAERVLEELDQLRRTLHLQVRRDAVVALGRAGDLGAGFSCGSALHLFHPRLRATRHFLRRDIFLMRRNDPHMPEGILQPAAAVAIEPVGNREHDFRAGGDRPLRERINVFDESPIGTVDPPSDCGLRL